ncbi:hypothetical protein SmJEL517_g03466 [Synchytrium microbalum]|uniref:ABC transporter domain-containing protein n=1 Tax=Synchytrium microbalum TaxID=1806994 RepID=A0A507C873_9FUNG|nr:uncharacterized protein SmJEL517_g03466 [Synchytrium microbalum]TPX33695.1 hypothetical protein SmJEL517_g03466 [Synchytrium microbalum]
MSLSTLKLAITKNKGLTALIAASAIYLITTPRVEIPKRKNEQTGANETDGEAQKRLDKRFSAQIMRLLPILIPGLFCKEVVLIVSLGTILIFRTWLDIWFSGFNGLVVRAVVSRDREAFITLVVMEFGMMMWPMSVTNNSLKLNISALALAFRDRLTKYAHDKYFKGITFYKISNIDNRIQNADQLLTQDIDKFCETLSHIYSDTAKPVVDIFLFSYKLGQALGPEAPFVMIGYFIGTAVLLRAFSPPFGRLTAQEQKLEGDFRFTHSRVITHSEEIAFYGGNQREKAVANASFDHIVRHQDRINWLHFINGIFDSILVKYCATMTAYYLLARPVFDPTYTSEFMGKMTADPTQIMEDYSRNSGYLVNLSQAIGRVILAGRDLQRLAGLTSRVSQLFDVLADVNEGRYTRTMIAKDGSELAQTQSISPSDLKGKVIIQDGIIKFDKTPIITPNGDLLVRQLSMRVDPGMNVLVTGPNGCGKSSLFRILGDLWPLFDGTLTKPSMDKMFYVPQKPYLALGTLRDQVIYPHSAKEAASRGYGDERIMELLATVHLEYLVSREGGWDAVADWADVLSGGEKQRVAMARMFYHKPEFAILDECTSAVSVDVEGIMYTAARDLGISLFTVSHRQTLFKYHDYLLRFDGLGGYTFDKMVDLDPFAFKAKVAADYSDSNGSNGSEDS